MSKLFLVFLILKIIFSIVVVCFVHWYIDLFFDGFVQLESAKISGPLYGTCAPVEHLLELNHQINGKLDQIVTMPYFSTYKINMEKECPFWAQQRLCNSNKCSVCECDNVEIPSFWKGMQQEEVNQQQSFAHQLDFGFGNKRKQDVAERKRKKDEWCFDELNEDDPDFIYVKMADNRESYTAYNGSNVWQSIYNENCMIERILDDRIDIKEQCTEVTLLYQLVSGLHASVNMHVTSNYYDINSNSSSYANHSMYHNAIGAHPDRLKNLYFVYAITVRALNLVHEQLIQNDYQTGVCSRRDAQTNLLVTDMLTNTIGECAIDLTFNESRLFQKKNDFEQNLLLEEIQDKFYNISRIFDCIGCDKCRFNGKIQIKGLGTAMKILFSNQQSLFQKELQKSEIIALIQLLQRLSESLNQHENFLKLEKEGKNNIMIKKHVISYIGVVIIFAIFKYIEYKISQSKRAPLVAEFDHLKGKPEKKANKKQSWEKKKKQKNE